jgi:dihydrofolate reductase
MSTTESRVSAIAAIGERSRALGKNGDLLFRIGEDLKRFHEITKGHPVIMGRKTWESLPSNKRPLPERANIVVTRQAGYEAVGGAVVSTLEDALTLAKKSVGADEIFIIGGGEIYTEAMPHTHRLYLTLVDDDTEGDVTFPPYDEFTTVVEKEKKTESQPHYTFVTLER